MAEKPRILTPEVAATRMNILLYGPQGAGKTKLAGEAQSIPDMSPVLYLNIEGGALTLAGRRDIHSVDIKSTKQLEEVFWALANKSDGYGEFKTVIIDSLSDLQTISLEEINAKAVADTRRPREQDDIYQDDYGISTVRLKRLLRWFRDWPGNTIYTALSRNIYPRGQETGTPIEVSPALSGALREAVMGYMDFVWYLFKRETKGEGTDRLESYVMLTRDMGIYRAKTRGDRFAPALGRSVDLLADGQNLPRLYQQYLDTEGRIKPNSDSKSKA